MLIFTFLLFYFKNNCADKRIKKDGKETGKTSFAIICQLPLWRMVVTRLLLWKECGGHSNHRFKKILSCFNLTHGVTRVLRMSDRGSFKIIYWLITRLHY